MFCKEDFIKESLVATDAAIVAAALCIITPHVCGQFWGSVPIQ